MGERRARATQQTIPLGRYPTPVQRVKSLSSNATELWIKRDDLTHPAYGGNKVRKLERLLAVLEAARARRIVTVGGAGSHHVLATTFFARDRGIDVEAVLVPQPRTAHATEVLRASLALGVRAFPVHSWAAAPLWIAQRMASGARYLAVGGSTVDGAMGYADAATELAAQIRAGEMPEPEICVVALGSGGTAAGLAAGFAAEGLRTRVLAVQVAPPAAALRAVTYWLAARCALRLGVRRPLSAVMAQLRIESGFLGAGYGHATKAGHAAAALARERLGLELDATYTAKAFAGALTQVQRGAERHVLYWHTLSGASPRALLGLSAPHPSAEASGVPALEAALDPELDALLLSGRETLT